MSINIVCDQLHSMLFILQQVSDVPMQQQSGWRSVWQALSPQQQEFNHLTASIFIDALAEDLEVHDLQHHLTLLRDQSPTMMQHRFLDRLSRVSNQDSAQLLDDVTSFWHAVQVVRFNRFVSLQSIRKAHSLLQQPEEWYAQLIDHVAHVWHQFLAPRWSMLVDQFQAAAQEARSTTSQPDSLTTLLKMWTQVDVPAKLAQLTTHASRVHVVVGATITPPSSLILADNVHWIATRAPNSIQYSFRTSLVSRAEVVARLQALADERRLAILELLTKHGELSAQEIISQLGLPQSTTSRFLNQLRAAGFVKEQRRGKTDKYYQLIDNHVYATWLTLNQLLAGELPSLDYEQSIIPTMQVPETIRRYVNTNGQLIHWPAKHVDRLIALEYLVGFFEYDRLYTELEVIKILREHPGTDHAHLRRALVDYGFLKRESNGSAYWRPKPSL